MKSRDLLHLILLAAGSIGLAWCCKPAHAATNDITYRQLDSSGVPRERTLTLTTDGFVDIDGTGRLRGDRTAAQMRAKLGVPSATEFQDAIGIDVGSWADALGVTPPGIRSLLSGGTGTLNLSGYTLNGNVTFTGNLGTDGNFTAYGSISAQTGGITSAGAIVAPSLSIGGTPDIDGMATDVQAAAGAAEDLVVNAKQLGNAMADPSTQARFTPAAWRGTAALNLPARNLFRLWDKIARVSEASSTTRLTYVALGDSLGYGVAQYIAPIVRAAFGDAGFFGPAGITANTATYSDFIGGAGFPGAWDHTMTPTGTYGILDASGEGVRWFLYQNQTPNAYPFSPRINPISGTNVDTIKVWYVREPGAGTFTVQSSVDGTTWVDVSGLVGVSASGALSLQMASATISATTLQAIRVIWASGAVKIYAGGALSSTRPGVVYADLTLGGMDIDDFVGGNGTAALLNELAPDFVSLMARDDYVGGSALGGTATTDGLADDLPALEALFSTLPDRLYLGLNQANGDDIAGVRAYNAAIRAHAAATGAAYLETLDYQVSYSAANARGWMSDNVHPNNRLWSLLAAAAMDHTGLSTLVSGGEWRAVNPVFVPSFTSPGPIGSVTASTGRFTTLGITTASDLDVENGQGFGLDSNWRVHIGSAYGVIFRLNNVNAFIFGTNGGFYVPKTITPSGTTGAQTINKPHGSVRFAAGAQTLVVTNSIVDANSTVIPVVYGTDATATSARVTKASGSFTLTLNAAATAETEVGFWVIN